MKTQEYYIGTRAGFDEMKKVIPSPRRMNQGMSKLLRKAAIDNGIKATEQRKRLEFYSVTSQEREILKDTTNDAFLALTENVTVRPLVEFNKEQFSDLINKINSNPDYQGGMNYDVSCRYEVEMRKSLAGILTKIGEDLNTRKKVEVQTHDYVVGDWISVVGDWNYLVGNARITKVTKASYWYEVAEIYGNQFCNGEMAEQRFTGVINEGGTHNSQEWDFTIPYEGNEEAFTFREPKMARASSYNPSKVEAGYRNERHERS